MNENKTQIVKLSHGFTYLKARIYLTSTGKVLRKIPKRSVTRERRKLKKLVRPYEEGKLTYQDIYTSWQSWRAYARNFSAWHTIQNIGKLYNRLFILPWIQRQPEAV